MKLKIIACFFFALVALPCAADWKEPQPQPAQQPAGAAAKQAAQPSCNCVKPKPVVHRAAVRPPTKPAAPAISAPAIVAPCDICKVVDKLADMQRDLIVSHEAIMKELVAHDALRAQADLNRSEAEKLDATANQTRATNEAATAQAAKALIPSQAKLAEAQAAWFNRLNKYPKSEEFRNWFGTFIGRGGASEVAAAALMPGTRVNANGGSAASSAVSQGGSVTNSGNSSSAASSVSSSHP